MFNNNQNQNGIHLEIKELFDKIKLSDVITLDKSVNTNFTKYSTSVQMSSDDFSLIRKHIEKDIASTISRKCIREIIDNSKNEYLDLTKYVNDIELDRLATNELIDYIIGSRYNKCILNVMLANCIQDDNRFHFKAMNQNTTINGADIYNIGFLSDIELYVDPYMRYNDNTMILLSDLRLNLELLDNNIVSEATFHPRILIDFNMYSEYDALVCRVIDKKGTENYLKYISDLRNQKIDDLLND
jgi:hypothetical protein